MRPSSRSKTSIASFSASAASARARVATMSLSRASQVIRTSCPPWRWWAPGRAEMRTSITSLRPSARLRSRSSTLRRSFSPKICGLTRWISISSPFPRPGAARSRGSDVAPRRPTAMAVPVWRTRGGLDDTSCGDTRQADWSWGPNRLPPRAGRWARLFKALGDPTRLEILRLVAAQPGPTSVCDLVERFDLAQLSASRRGRARA